MNPVPLKPAMWTMLLVGLTTNFLPAEEQNLAPLESREYIRNNQEGLRYWQYLPEGYHESTGETYPLLLFLHGGGESGSDLELVKKHGIPKEILKGRKLPCIVLAPQNPREKGLWDDRMLDHLLDSRIESLRVDESRIYLAGLSRGGHGVYRLAIQHPEKFAAVVAVCGGGPVAYAPRCEEVPFWFFHGDSDKLVPTEESHRLSAAINKAGGNAKLTIYPNTGHNSWDQAFAGDELYRWLFAQQRTD